MFDDALPPCCLISPFLPILHTPLRLSKGPQIHVHTFSSSFTASIKHTLPIQHKHTPHIHTSTTKATTTPPPPAIKAATAAKHAFKHATKTAKKTPVPRALHREIKYEIPRLFDPRYVKDTSESGGVKAKEQAQAGVEKVSGQDGRGQARRGRARSPRAARFYR